tara:strand:+ start:654 stop:4844 length:4191 start_codon:yes stop_codon:yes gene_type:complete
MPRYTVTSPDGKKHQITSDTPLTGAMAVEQVNRAKRASEQAMVADEAEAARIRREIDDAERAAEDEEERILRETREAALDSPGTPVSAESLRRREDWEQALLADRARQPLVDLGDSARFAASAASAGLGALKGAAGRAVESMHSAGLLNTVDTANVLMQPPGPAAQQPPAGEAGAGDTHWWPGNVSPEVMAAVEEDLKKNIDRKWSDAITDDLDGIVEMAIVASDSLTRTPPGEAFDKGVVVGEMLEEGMEADTAIMLSDPVGFSMAYPVQTLAMIAAPAVRGALAARGALRSRRIKKLMKAAEEAELSARRLEGKARLALPAPEEPLALPAPSVQSAMRMAEQAPVEVPPPVPQTLPEGAMAQRPLALPSPADVTTAPVDVSVPPMQRANVPEDALFKFSTSGRKEEYPLPGRGGVELSPGEIAFAEKAAAHPAGQDFRAYEWIRNQIQRADAEDWLAEQARFRTIERASASGPIELPQTPKSDRIRRASMYAEQLADIDPVVKQLMTMADDVPPQKIADDVATLIDAPIDQAQDALDAAKIARQQITKKIQARRGTRIDATPEMDVGPLTQVERQFGVKIVEDIPKPSSAAEAVERIMDPNVTIKAKDVSKKPKKRTAPIAGSEKSLEDTAKVMDAVIKASSPKGPSAPPRARKAAPKKKQRSTTTPPPAPPLPKKTPGLAESVSRGASEAVQANHAAIEARRAEKGLSPLPKTTRTWEEAMDAARQVEAELPEHAFALAASVLENPAPLSDVQSAVIVRKMAYLAASADAIARKMDTLDVATDPKQYSALRKQMDSTEDARNLLDEAYHASGSEKGRALAIQAMAVSRKYDSHVVKARAKAKWGRNLSDDEKRKFEALAAKSREVFTRLEKLEKASLELERRMRKVASASDSPESLLKNPKFKSEGKKMDDLRKHKLKELKEANKLMKETENAIMEGAPLYDRMKANLNEMFELPRTIKSSWDLSAPGRQGLVLSVSSPTRAAKAFKEMLVAAWDEDKYMDINYSLVDGPKGRTRTASGVEFTGVNEMSVRGLTQREEVFRSNLIAQWADSGNPVFRTIGQVIKSSERAYVTYLNSLRAGVFDAMTGLDDAGRVTAGYNQAELKFIGEFINRATGRGSFGPLESPVVSKGMAKVMYAPRLKMSRFQTALHATKFWGSGRGVKWNSKARLAVAKQYWLQSVAPRLALMWIADSMGHDVGWDHESGTKVGRITIGDMTLDIHGGEQQVYRALLEAWSDGRYLQTGEWVEGDPVDPFLKMFRYSLHPVTSVGYSIASNEDVFGKEFPGQRGWNPNVAEELGSLLVPIGVASFFNDLVSAPAIQARIDRRDLEISDVVDPSNIASAVAGATPEFFGIGSRRPDETTAGQALGIVPSPGPTSMRRMRRPLSIKRSMPR